MTRGTVKTNVKVNLGNSVFYGETDLNDSLQDAYDDVIINTQVRITSVTKPWVSDLSYYIWPDQGITDLLAPIAVFNVNTNLFLEDGFSVRDFDKFRLDWEQWNGEPYMWAPVAFDRIAIAPKQLVASGTYKLFYWQVAETLTDDSDVLSLHKDAARLLEYYSTADLLEQAEEFTKAGKYWETYFARVREYADRAKQVAKRDLMLRL